MKTLKARILIPAAISVLFVFFLLAPPSDAEESFNIQMFNPDIFGGGYLSLSNASTLPQLGFGFGFYYDRASSLFTYYLDDEPEFDAISQLHSMNLSAAFGIMDWWNIGLQVPMHTMRHREIADLSAPEDRGELTDSDFVVGDIKAEMKFRCLVQDKHWLGMAMAPFGKFSTGDTDLLLGEGRFTGGARLIIDHDFDFFEIALNGGYMARGTSNELFDSEVGDAILYGAGIARSFDFGLGFGLEYVGRQYMVEDTEKVFNAPMELLFFLQYRIGKKGPRLVAGAGPGLTNGIGTPAYRMVAGIDYFHEPSKGPKTGIVIIRTTDENGQGIAAKVSVSGPYGTPPDYHTDGEYRVELKPGNYTVNASAENRESAQAKVEIKKGKEQTITLKLPMVKVAESSLVINLIDKCSKDKLNGKLTLEDGTVIQIQDGYFEGVMEPGKYQGNLTETGYPERIVFFEIDQGKQSTVDLELSKPGTIEKSGKIVFMEGTAEILPTAYPVLNDLADQLGKVCDFSILIVEGHMDPGPDAQALSESRANAVVKYLIGKGVDQSKLKAVGLGDSKPVAPNLMAWGREQNRRIEFKLEQ